MNERIKELMNQTDGEFYEGFAGSPNHISFKEDELQKFAELIIRECKENFAKVWYEGLDIQGNAIGKFMTRFDKHFGVEE